MREHANLLGGLMLAALAALGLGACSDPSGLTAGDLELSRLLRLELRQDDRFGLPAIATVFIPTDQKNAYNEAIPADDEANFKDEIVAKLLSFGHDEASANALADALTPDVQPINTSQPTTFLNGRRPEDDVITAELMLIFGNNAALNDDHVDSNDVLFLATFPYLAGPHTE